MDSNMWNSRLAAAKKHYSLQQQQSAQSDRFHVDEYELEEQVRPDYACPFCYEDHDITPLCSHLEDQQHPFESKASRCRRSRRVAIPNGQALSLQGRDLREVHLQVLSGSRAYWSSNSSTSTTAADSFMSSIVLNFPASEAEETSKSSLSHVDGFIRKKLTTTRTGNSSSFDLSLSQEEREKKQRQATIRAKFVQDLLLSSLFGD